MHISRRVPMMFTLMRLLLAPAFLLARAEEAGVAVLLVIVGLVVFTDWLDGFLARRWKAVSSAGKLLDPFADALFCLVALFDCWRNLPQLMPGWIFFIMLAREAFMTLVLRPISLWHGLVIGANILGKTKTVLQFVVITAFVLLQARSWAGTGVILTAGRAAAVGAVFFSLLSAAVYIRTGWRGLHSRRAGPAGGGTGVPRSRETEGI